MNAGASGAESRGSTARTQVFISYAHEDREWLEKLQTHLVPLEREGLVDRWDDSEIKPGTPWHAEIERALGAARVAVLLVSKYFLASEFIFDEELPALLAAAAEDGAVIVPVILGPCLFAETPSLSRFQAVNTDGPTMAELTEPEQDRVWLRLLANIEGVLERTVLLTAPQDEAETARALQEALKDRYFAVDLQLWASAEGAETDTELGAELTERLWRNRALLLVAGEGGIGPWNESTLLAGRAQGRAVLAVLPAGRREFPPLPAFLPRHARRRLVRGPGDSATLDWLEQGLAGELPTPAEDEAPEPVAEPGSGDVESGSGVESAVARIAPLLAGENLTVFLGPGTHPGDRRFPPRPFEITRELLGELELFDPRHDAPPLLPTLEVAGNYFAVRSGERHLEHEIGALISERSRGVPPAYRRLAELLRRLEATPSGPRRARPKRLVVSGQLDVLFERALLEAGVSFTRLVQHRSGRRIDVNEYRGVEIVGERRLRYLTPNGSETARFDEIEEVITYAGRHTVERVAGAGDGATNTLDALALEEYTPPYLFKFFGSSDVASSAAISAEQCRGLLSELAAHQIVPAKIRAIVTEGPVLLLGCGLLDPAFYLTWSTFAGELGAGNGRARYDVRPAPDDELADDYRRMERHLWEDIKLRERERFALETIEAWGELFLERLLGRLAP